MCLYVSGIQSGEGFLVQLCGVLKGFCVLLVWALPAANHPCFTQHTCTLTCMHTCTHAHAHNTHTHTYTHSSQTMKNWTRLCHPTSTSSLNLRSTPVHPRSSCTHPLVALPSALSASPRDRTRRRPSGGDSRLLPTRNPTSSATRRRGDAWGNLTLLWWGEDMCTVYNTVEKPRYWATLSTLANCLCALHVHFSCELYQPIHSWHVCCLEISNCCRVPRQDIIRPCMAHAVLQRILNCSMHVGYVYL